MVQIAFVLMDDFNLKRVCFLDTLQEKAESRSDDAARLCVR
ncbi:hypothetical protein [Kingella kingae]|nr:hypothetical protein [Kingella kingae]